ncbi:MAG: alpha-amylase family glycosyl hydrolase [Candidatus Magnetominusculus sp. LBB02]|nr:alpha-amylase family glycosyl hydrolase [Candidatus Magnetominusculus sp. LBB02]
MVDSVFGPEYRAVIDGAMKKGTRSVSVNGKKVEFPTPFPSPEDWRDNMIYFLMVDRFNNPSKQPNNLPYDAKYSKFQGGTLNGIREKLDYLASMGAGALWLSPVLKNCQAQDTYHNYGIMDFLNIDPRFGTNDDMVNLVNEAHARGMYVIMDIVLNHAGDIFEYEVNGSRHAEMPWSDTAYDIYWRDEKNRGQWKDAPAKCHPDAAVWPSELRRNDFFRRKGRTDKNELEGDFCSLKEMVTEYKDTAAKHDYYPVRNILIKAYQYAIAKFDLDGFRIDTLKYIERDFELLFGNSMREFALSIGKKNFFMFGEIFDGDDKIGNYIGRHSSDEQGVIGVDASLDFPLYFVLPGVIKGNIPARSVVDMFNKRKDIQKDLLSSHGEAGKYFVTFLDNHDVKYRFYYRDPVSPAKYDPQLTMGLAALLMIQGVPCVYYGTEQGLCGHIKSNDDSDDSYIREALWGKPGGFDESHPFYKALRELTAVRSANPALRYGRQYFRQVSDVGYNFAIADSPRGVLAFSRILNETENLVVLNTNTETSWNGNVIVDYALNPVGSKWNVLYSNLASKAQYTTMEFAEGRARIVNYGGNVTNGPARAINIKLLPMEVQILGK